uniref:Uncharacterized protein n=1 Tax=Rhizophora mucronata TaxID=61149 RepID=A0A2P2QJ33_RHIMU
MGFQKIENLNNFQSKSVIPQAK